MSYLAVKEITIRYILFVNVIVMEYSTKCAKN